MRIEQLQYLIDVAKTNSINISAERMYVTQPTMSEAFNKLEEELGAKVLERSKKGVKLTQAGIVAVEEAEKVLLAIDNLQQRVNQVVYQCDSQLGGELRIGAASLSTNIMLPRIIAKFQMYMRNINLNIFEVPQLEIGNLLDQGHISLGIINCINAPRHSISNEFKELLDKEKYIIEKIYSEKVGIIVNKDSHLAKEKVVSLENLIKQPLVLFENHTGDDKPIKKMLLEHGEINIAMSTNNSEMYKQCILNGVGAALFTPSCFRDLYYDEINLRGALKFIPIADEVSVEYFSIYKKNRINIKNEDAFLRYVKKYFENLS